ncbi:branched-chain amino acid ABC transporter permease [Candidatus Woesearchaeota archaeon]|nr:branched-chain amino acid ABC transporter permease [Candidatus Woesearchaeota archaeon]
MIHDFLIYFLLIVLIYTIIVMSFNLAVGFTGLVNLGHMVFFGIGAYASALLALSGAPWYLAVPSSALIAALSGAIIAALTVRLKGDYFQIVTLGLVFIAVTLSRNWISLTRGALGLPGVPPIFKDSLHYMIFVMAVFALSVIFFYWLTNSGTGKIFQAIRDDETASSVLGKNTYFYKILSITISTFFAGLAGSLFVHYIKFVDPTIFDLEFFVLILSMLIAGGLASIQGSIAGVFTLGIFVELIRFIDRVPLLSTVLAQHPELIGASRTMVYSVIVIYLLIFRPRGIFGRVEV